MMRPLALLLALSFAATAALAPVASAAPPILDGQCVNVREDVTACGAAFISFPSVGSGAGAATGIVDWQLVVVADSGVRASPVVSAPAVSLVTVGTSTTRDCATAYLYADGLLVARSDKLCWDV